MRVIRYPLAIVLLQLVLAGPALAQRAYTLVFVDDGPMALLRFDPATGSSLLIGPLGAAAEALTADAAGNLYAADRAAGLLAVDPGTGVATPIGPFGVTVARVRGLAFDDAGTLWMLADLPGGPGPQQLFRVDPDTGVATPDVAPVYLPEIELLTLAALGGRLYSVGQISFSTFLCEIDLGTGQVALIGEDLAGPAIIPSRMVGDPERGDLFAIAFKELSASNTQYTIRVDPATGDLSDRLALPFTVGADATYGRLVGVALGTAPGPLDIPALGAGGAAILIVLLAIAGLLIRCGGLR